MTALEKTITDLKGGLSQGKAPGSIRRQGDEGKARATSFAVVFAGRIGPVRVSRLKAHSVG